MPVRPRKAKPKPASKGTKGEETRDRIHAAALSLFRKKGFDATTMRDVAAAAGVALGAAYYYFPSKEALVLAYYRRTHAESTAQAEAVFATSHDLRARLGAAFHAKLDVLAHDRKLLSGLFRSIADPSAEASIFGEHTRAIRDDSIDLFDRAIAPSPELAALDAAARKVLVLALWSLHMGVILYFIHDASPKQQRTRALVDQSLDLVCNILPLAPGLFPLFGPAIGSILANAGLVTPPQRHETFLAR
jgi:AcrR family transcriptional regulator